MSVVPDLNTTQLTSTTKRRIVKTFGKLQFCEFSIVLILDTNKNQSRRNCVFNSDFSYLYKSGKENLVNIVLLVSCIHSYVLLLR